MLTPNYLNIPTVYTSTHWTPDSVRGCCIECDYYTKGDNTDYSWMLTFVGEASPTTENVYAVALDIVLHSDVKDRYCCSTDEAIEAVMYELYQRAISTTVEIER